MIKQYERLLRHGVSQNDLLQKNKLYLRLVLQNACLITLAAHLIFLAFFMLTRVWPLALTNIFSVCCYLFCYRLTQKELLPFAGIVMSIEIAIYVLISSIIVGTGDYLLTIIFIDLVLQLSVPYASVRCRRLVGTILAPYTIFLLIAGTFIAPRVHLGKAGPVFSILNVSLSLAVICIGFLAFPQMKISVDHYINRQLERLKNEAYIDPLTQLYNRRYADIIFDRLRRFGDGTWCVAIMDIDDFKSINDDYGHMAGDLVLKELSSVIQDIMRSTDFVFRWGGEEFLFLLRATNPAQAFTILDRVRQKLAETSIYHEHSAIHFTVTVGVGSLDIDDIPGSINRCDQKMYQGKRRGKNVAVI